MPDRGQDLTPAGLIQTMLSTSRDLDAAQAELVRRAHLRADADHKLRVTRASAYLASQGTVAEREAHVAKVCDEEMYQAQLAEGLERAALELVRSKRAQLSALQSIAAAVKAEAELLRTGVA